MRKIGIALTAVALTVAAYVPASAAGAGYEGRYDRPQTGFAPSATKLSNGTPEQVGLDPKPIDKAVEQVHDYTEPTSDAKPLFAGAVSAFGHAGKVVEHDAHGWGLRYKNNKGDELPRDEWQPVEKDTIFDMASVSKLFTSIAVMQQAEAGKIDIDAPIARYIPEFAENGKEKITVRQALTHTSGLEPFLDLWSDYPDKESRMEAVLKVKPQEKPGSTYIYSDLNLITLGELVHRVSGKTLDKAVADGITKPLRMKDTGYNPKKSLKPRIAATEDQSGEGTAERGMVHGEVHDENAWSLGGVAGHAGVFSTAKDMSLLAQAMLNGGKYRGERILSRSSVEQMITNFNQDYPGNDHGLGFELNQRWYMSGLSGPRTAGHTGYTGTSLVIDYASRSFAILLSNRVHPSRDWGSNNPARQAVAQGLAESLAIKPRRGPDAWSASVAPEKESTLDAPVKVPSDGGELSFDLFMDSEETDQLHLETSTDGKKWQKVPFKVADRDSVTGTDGSYSESGDRRWKKVSASLEAGKQTLRWRYATDAEYTGRGVFVDGVKAVSLTDTLFDGEKEPDAFKAKGWKAVKR